MKLKIRQVVERKGGIREEPLSFPERYSMFSRLNFSKWKFVSNQFFSLWEIQLLQTVTVCMWMTVFKPVGKIHWSFIIDQTVLSIKYYHRSPEKYRGAGMWLSEPPTEPFMQNRTIPLKVINFRLTKAKSLVMDLDQWFSTFSGKFPPLSIANLSFPPTREQWRMKARALFWYRPPCASRAKFWRKFWNSKCCPSQARIQDSEGGVSYRNLG